MVYTATRCLPWGLENSLSQVYGDKARIVNGEALSPFFLHRNEMKREGIDAVAGILWCEILPCEDMPEMGIAVRAHYLCPAAIGIGYMLHRVWEFLIETRPAAARVEFRVRDIQRGCAAPADIRTFSEEIIILPRKRCLGPFVHDDAFLFRCQYSHQCDYFNFFTSARISAA